MPALTRAAVVVCLVLATIAPAAAALNPGRVLPSVAGVGRVGSDAIHCTASSIGHRRWLSAAHCVPPVPGAVYTIAGDAAVRLLLDVPNDLAIFETATATAPALKLARRAPRVGDEISVVGHPLGIPDVLFARGWVMGTHVDIGWERPFLVIQAAGAPGNSGSPILDSRGEIVSVLQVGWSRAFSPVMAGVVWETLDALRGWFGR